MTAEALRVIGVSVLKAEEMQELIHAKIGLTEPSIPALLDNPRLGTVAADGNFWCSWRSQQNKIWSQPKTSR